ncbi:MAG: GNAT family N-acetyltransferase [Verrucomicrobiota bacterium]
MMNIREISDTESASYDGLAREHGTVFHSAAWTALFGDGLVRYGVFQKNGDLIAGFCLRRIVVLGMEVFRTPPFTPQCGPFFRIKAQKPVAVLEARREILDAVAEFLDRRSCALVSVGLDPRIQDTLPFVWRKFKVVPRYTYVLDLASSLEDVQANMSPATRNDISKATRDGLVVRQTTDPMVIRDLVRETFARQHVHTDAQHLDAILFRFSNPDNRFMFTTYRGDSPIAGCFIVHDSKTAYNLLAGYKAAEKHHGAGALAVFEAIKHAKVIGLKTFDFEGSMIPAIERYFRGFGGRLTPYFAVNKAWLPLEIGLKFFKRELF